VSVSEDASTPAVATTAGGSAATTLTTASFSPPAGSVLVAMCEINWGTYPGSPPAITVTDTAGGTWTAGPSVQLAAAGAKTAIFTRPAVSAPGSVTVTMSRGADSSAAMLKLAVRVCAGANTSAPQGASGTASGTGTGSGFSVAATLTPTALGSLLYVAADHANNNATTALTGTTQLSQTSDGTDGGVLSAGVSSSVTSSLAAQTLGWSANLPSSDGYVAAALEILATGSHSGTATLSGSGTLTAMGAFAGAAALAGSGTLTWSGSRVYKATVLSGSGTLTGTRHGTAAGAAVLSGSGTLTGAGAATRFRAAALSGSGTLAVPGYTLGVAAALSGTGTLTIIGTGGTVQASAGLSSPYARPGTSQVAVAPPGTQAWQYLGTLGLVTSLTYSFVMPGGADKLTCTVQVPASYRTQLLWPGWQVRVTRGGHVVWTGRLDEPVPSPSGWQVTAVGDGQRGQDFRAVYSSAWPSGEPDQAVNNAIARGLPWSNPGIGTPSGIWLGQAQDSGAGTVADLLNLACTRGGLTWYASSQPGGQPGTDLSVFPLPTAVNRLLVVTDPVPRTLGGDVNTIYIRYQSADASSSTSGNQQATFGTTSVQNAASVAAHGVTETYMDLSSAGTMSAGAAQAVGNNVLAIYQRASFAGPFTAARGQLLTAGGAPVDPGCDQAGTVVRLILTDYAYGGEVAPGSPVTFITGGYTWDDFAQKAAIAPYQSLDESLSGLLSMQSAILTPITTQQ
jgi:hypothetical protein